MCDKVSKTPGFTVSESIPVPGKQRSIIEKTRSLSMPLHALQYFRFLKNMDNDIVTTIVQLYKEKNWRELVEKFYGHPKRNKLLWVFPSEDNFRFLGECLKELCCDKVLSIGCGSGLLEWMITEATGYPVQGVEVDGAWWSCKYAPPQFIPLLLTTAQLDKQVIKALNDTTTALLFCYFNNRPAFENYLKHFQGNILIIIGPEGKDVHTDPKPFNDVGKEWNILEWQEVRDSKDFIVIYRKTV